jgi:hypothetical protein
MIDRLLIPGAIIGAAFGLAIGYLDFKWSGGSGTILQWFTLGLHVSPHSFPRDSLLWMLGGAVIVTALAVVRMNSQK